jgi:UDP-N-acetylglucosamine--N-acetylmuramyl-(pentapeptide) pyrophosphoryl-undecaprenol N-acetylglucosamine transferase
LEKVEKSKKIIFTGGGSGGHLMIIKGLIEYIRGEEYKTLNYPEPEILVVGGKLGMINDPGMSLDARLIPTFGEPYKLIRGGKFHRAFKWMTIKLFFGFFGGLWDAFQIIREFDPDVIFATGGYVTLPMIIVGWILGKKIIIHEQTLSAGLANRIGGIFANRVLLTFAESEKFFLRRKRVVTGNLVRSEVINSICDIDELRQLIERVKREARKIIYITGGSLGAHKINDFIKANLTQLCERYTLIWQTGDNRFHSDFLKFQSEVIQGEYDSLHLVSRGDFLVGENLFITKFVQDEIGYVLQSADIVVARPGANTLYELAILGKKAILIPLWVTSSSDQKRNAMWYIQKMSGVLLEEQNLSYDIFKQNIEELLSKPECQPLDYDPRTPGRIISFLHSM